MKIMSTRELINKKGEHKTFVEYAAQIHKSIEKSLIVVELNDSEGVMSAKIHNAVEGANAITRALATGEWKYKDEAYLPPV